MNLFDFNLTLPITDPTWVFFLVLIIILFAPMILGHLHIPHIIGMILAGVLIGEHGFHVLDRDSSFELFGKVGLYYIMFLAGLEMDMEATTTIALLPAKDITSVKTTWHGESWFRQTSNGLWNM